MEGRSAEIVVRGGDGSVAHVHSITGGPMLL